MLGARQYISVVYKSAMGGTDMERHRRGWKETPLEARRFLRFIAGQRQRDFASLPSSLPAIIVSLRAPCLRAPLHANF